MIFIGFLKIEDIFRQFHTNIHLQLSPCIRRKLVI
nr:MAG TPA: hypothetical protein [Inoviridae sp.]